MSCGVPVLWNKVKYKKVKKKTELNGSEKTWELKFRKHFEIQEGKGVRASQL